ncbi:cell division control protein Cdc6 [Candidatus Pacearchaeota archaeon ex4484_26]|nr:MAG: cell division control protein Cdc6 [Candidatus Pacearchaeota archaeon ex4484_26]
MLDEIFENFTKNTIFKNKKILQSSYTPETILHRENEIKQLASVLAPALRAEKPSNLFLYGVTGTGKTLSVKYVVEQLLKKANENNINLKIIYINCKLKKVADTEYRILAEILNELGRKVPATGLPTDSLYKLFTEIISEQEVLLILILDEIDQAVEKIGDSLLYNLTRLDSSLRNSQISIVGISNKLTFVDTLDPRVRSSLSEEEIMFHPYNALQLKDILKQRTKEAFKEGVIGEGVLEKCAAYAASEHGDARRALDLLRVSGELVEREREKKIELEHVDIAEAKIEKDRILDIIKSQPKQFQLTMLSIIKNAKQNNGKAFYTGDVFEKYSDFCQATKIKEITPRRISDIIGEFDMLGLITAKVISKGRGGKTREIKLAINKNLIDKVENLLHENLNL